MPKRFSHMFMCGSLQFTCMARGGDGWQAMTVIFNALKITTGAALHLFDFLFYAVSNFFCCCHTCSHNRGITTCVLSLTGVQMACIHLLMHLLHLRSSLRNRLMTLNVSSMSFAFSECLQIAFSPNKTYILFPSPLCSVAFLSEPNMKIRFPVTTLFASNGRREQ